jgi:DNA-binding transcriptional ArsR family regulator
MTVEEAIDTVEAALRRHHTAYLTALREDGLVPLREALDAALDAHKEARRRLPEAEAPTRHALWTALQDYRQTTAETVWTPLRKQLDDLDLGRLLRDRGLALDEALATVAEDVPDTITRPEPDGLYAPDDADEWTHRLGKIGVRLGRALRERVASPTTAEQTVPMTVLVQRAATRLLGEQSAVLDRVEQTVAAWAARLERVASGWTHRLLEMERVLDRPSFHSAEEAAPIETPEGDPTTGVMEADVAALRAEATEQAETLHQCLDDGRSLALDAEAERLADLRATMIDRLRTAAERAGTFMADHGGGGTAVADGVPQARRRTRADRWPDWFDQVEHRLEMLDTFAALRDALAERHRTLLADARAAGLAPTQEVVATAATRLRTLRDDLDALLATPDDGDELDLIQAFDHTADTATDIIERDLQAPLRDLTPRRALQAVVEAHREAVAALVEEQPETFVLHPLPAPDAASVDPDESYTLDWTHDCRAVLDELLFDAWADALDPFGKTAEAQVERAAEVRAVVQFNLGTALQDLQDLRAARREGRADESYLENARELALGGLDRALDLLEEQDASASSAEVLRRTWRATTDAWTDLHDRLRAAGQTRAHVLRLRGELVRGARWLAVETGRQVRGTTTQVRRTLYRAQRQAQRLVRLGHAAVGTTPVDEAALRETVDALSSIDTVLADLPLVYRRLFSFRPLQTPDLLVAREGDRAVVERHAERWRDGLTNALVLTGPAGSGRTSLLNVLRKTTFRAAQRHTLELTERVTSESAFARAVAQALNLSMNVEGAPTLDAVAEHLRQQPVPDRLRVCVIEHFEHVFHRTVGGMELGARILNFLSETDTRVLWVATTTDATWQIVEASEPAAARLVVRHRLDPLDRGELETLIMTRHQRSGLPLEFEVPEEATHPILARRVKAHDDPERRQTLLRTEFFDQLYDACGQNVMLALFYWFRSVTLDPDGAMMRVRPLASVSFEVLETFPLPHAFALKALLEHGTLTVGELAAVLEVDAETSRSLLETLGNALVIAPADRVEGPGVFQFASVDRETRYRIRPLLIQPVTRFLRSRNIVH